MSLQLIFLYSYNFRIKALHKEQTFGIMVLGTFNKLGGANLRKEGRRYNEQERLINLCFSNDYLPFIIIVIYNFNIKESHLTHPMI